MNEQGLNQSYAAAVIPRRSIGFELPFSDDGNIATNCYKKIQQSSRKSIEKKFTEKIFRIS